MTDLKLEIDSVSVQFKVLELENRLPSFKVGLSIKIIHPTGEFNYTADNIWFECGSWDFFVNKLVVNDVSFKLNSMSEEFTLTISNNKLIIEIKEILYGDVVTELTHSRPFSIEDYSTIKQSFKQFDKWW